MDIIIYATGSITLIIPATERAHDWVAENIQAEPWQLYGGGVACEPRLVQTIIDAAEEAGLSCQY